MLPAGSKGPWFELAFQAAPIGMTVARLPDGVIVDANPAWLALVGAEFDSVVGKTADAAGIQLGLDFEALGRQLMATHIFGPVEHDLQGRAGRRTVLSVGALVEDGPRQFVLGWTLDLTEARQTERLLHRMFDSIHVLVAYMDRDFNFLQVNRAYARADGREPRDYVGKNHFGMFPDPENEAIFRRVVETGEPYEIAAKPFVYAEHPERGTSYWDWRVQPVKALDGTVEGILLSLLDVTKMVQAEQHRLELQAKQAEVQRLQEMDRFRSNLMNMIAHELKNPLTPLLVEAAILRRESSGLTPKLLRGIDLVERNVHRVNAIVEDLLDASRLDAGTVKLDVRSTDLSAVAKEAVESYREVAARVSLRLDLVPAEGVVVEADRGRLLQVLYNLISNAIKYTPEGGHVEVWVERRADAAVVRITDTGLGLTQEQIGTLFKPLATVHQPVHAGFKGTGLGLFISKGMVELHGGQLHAESPGPGQGSTFWFSLPFTQPAPASKQR